MILSDDRITLFLISQAIIWLPLAAGYHLRRTGVIGAGWAIPLHLVNLVFISPLAVGLGLWHLDRAAAGWTLAPIIMGLLMTGSTLGANWLSPRLTRNPASAGSFAIMIPLSNIGYTMAGMITLLVYGDKGYALNTLLMWPLNFFNFFVWLPQARHWGRGNGQPFLRSMRQSLLSAQSLSIVGMVAGAGLNAAGVPMHHFWLPVMKTFVYLGTATIMFALGCRFDLSRMKGNRRLVTWLCLCKFFIHPVFVMALCLLLGVRGVTAGVLLIAACAPAGVFTVTFSALHNLDVDLANAGYLWSTLLYMLAVLPLLLLVLRAVYFALP